MLNKRAQIPDIGEILKLILVLVIVIPFFVAIIGMLGSLNKQCPTCEDCSQYKNQISNLSQNISECLNKSKEIVYVNQTIEVPKIEVKEVPIKEEPNYTLFLLIASSLSFLGLFLALSFKFSFSLFKIKFKINLSDEVKKHLEEYENAILWIKRGSLLLAILIFLRLGWILIKLF